MANELAIKVKVELDTDYKKLDEQLKKVKEHYSKTPVKLAFGLNQNETKSNINSALKSLIDGKQIKVPTVTLDVKIDKKATAANISAQLKEAAKGVKIGDDTSSSSNEKVRQQLSAFYDTVKNIASLNDKISFADPSNTEQIKVWGEQFSVAEQKLTTLMNALSEHIDISEYSKLSEMTEKLANKSAEAAAKLKDAQAKEAAKAIEAQAKAEAKAAQEAEKEANALAHVTAEIENQKKAASNMLNTAYKNAGSDVDISNFLGEYQKLQNLLNDGSQKTPEYLRKVQDQIKACNIALKETSDRAAAANKSFATKTEFKNLSAEIERFVAANKNLANDDKLYAKIQKVRYEVQNGSGDLREQKLAWADCVSEAERLGLTTENLGQKLSRLFKEHFQTAIAMAGIHALQQGLRAVYQNVVEIDTAMTELKKVTNETSTGYSSYIDRASTQAKELGISISDYVQSTADWARLGYGLPDAEELARVASLYKNVGDGVESASQASEYLISTLKGFNLDASDAEHVLDVINQVANTQPVSAQGIGEFLKRSSAAMSVANNTFEETVALGTAMNSVLQDEEKTGNVLKTVSMYLRATKAELEDAGESTEGMANTVSELRESLLALTHNEVDIQLDDDTYKSTYEIIKEMSNAWDEMTDKERAAALELMGGKRNSNAVAALIEQFSIAEDSLAQVEQAAGSADRELEKRKNSIEGKLNQLDTAFQKFSNDLLDSEIVKGLVSIGTGIISFTDSVIELTGVLPLLATALTTTFSVGKPKLTGFSIMPTNTLMVTLNEFVDIPQARGYLVKPTNMTHKGGEFR